MATTEETLKGYQEDQVRLKRQLRELQAKRAKALPTGQSLVAIDTEIGEVTKKLDELRRYFAHHPDA